jgi:Ca-activated chloride channel family protein
MNLSELQFQTREWLWLSIPLLILTGVLFSIGKRVRRKRLEKLLRPDLRDSFTRALNLPMRRIRQALLALTLLLLCFALARPQLGYLWEERPEQSTDILFALDTSRSMLAPDLKPNRLERAKLALEDLVQSLEGVRIGLIPFAGDAMLWCPLTYDIDAFLETLRNVDTELIPVGGSNLLSAVETASRAFADDRKAAKVMVLITDGEDLSGQLESKLPSLIRQGWTLHTIGIGTDEGELIPIQAEDGSSRFVTDAEGNVIKTRLDSATLEYIAEQTKGRYLPLGPTGEGLQRLFETTIRPQLQVREESRMRKIPIERYAWVAAAILLLLVVESVLSDRKQTLSKTGNLPVLLMTCAFFPLSPDSGLMAASGRSAQKAYDQGLYSEAQQAYEGLASREDAPMSMRYNAGVAAMRNGDWEQAKKWLDQSTTAEDLELQFKSYYNRGQTHYAIGRSRIDTNPSECVKLWEQALKDYDSALALKAEDPSATKNCSEVQKSLEQLKKLLEQQPQNQPQPEGESSDENDPKDGEPSETKGSGDSSGDSKSDPASGEQNPSGDQQQQEKPSDPDASEKGQEGQEQEPKDGSSSPEPENPSPGEAEEPQNPSDPQTPPDQGPEQADENPSPQTPPSDAPDQDASPPDPKDSSGKAGEAGQDKQREAVLRLLDSLEQEEGDAKTLLYRLQEPEVQPQPDKNW